MLAVIAAILFVVSWFEHGAKATGVPIWFNSEGLKIAGLVFLALSLIWHPTIPVVRRQPPPPQ